MVTIITSDTTIKDLKNLMEIYKDISKMLGFLEGERLYYSPIVADFLESMHEQIEAATGLMIPEED